MNQLLLILDTITLWSRFQSFHPASFNPAAIRTTFSSYEKKKEGENEHEEKPRCLVEQSKRYQS
jgi:hypothetical protein